MYWDLWCLAMWLSIWDNCATCKEVDPYFSHKCEKIQKKLSRMIYSIALCIEIYGACLATWPKHMGQLSHMQSGWSLFFSSSLPRMIACVRERKKREREREGRRKRKRKRRRRMDSLKVIVIFLWVDLWVFHCGFFGLNLYIYIYGV